MSDYTHEYRARTDKTDTWSKWFPTIADANGVVSVYTAVGGAQIEIRPWKARWKTGSYTHKSNENTFECLYVDDDGNGYGMLTATVASGPVTYPDGLDAYSLKDWERDES